MEEEKEYRHSCRYCEKKFRCGRALGGHMRSHMTMPWNETDESYQKAKRDDRASDDMCGGIDGPNQGGYGLRENPKKSLRFSDSVTLVTKVCKECGKAFPSLKALFGHMKCHSEKCAQDEGSCSEVHDAMDDHSDSEAAPRRRSRRKARCAALSSISGSLSVDRSSVCDIEQERKYVAISLMMLSRDASGFWKGSAPEENLPEASDNSSASKIFRSRFKREVGMKSKQSIDFVFDCSVRKPFKTRNSSTQTVFQGSIDNGKKTIASKERKKAKLGVNGGEGSVLSLIDSNKESQYECEEIDCEVSNSSELAGFHISGTDIERRAQKGRRMNSDELGGRQKPSSKLVGYECTSCKRVFPSYQALGGHRASHKRVKGCYARVDESENNSTKTNLFPVQDDPTIAEDELKYFETANPTESENAAEDTEADVALKKTKVHECRVCLKVFNSGQALGGHKRSHVLSGSSIIRGGHQNTVLIRRQMPVTGDFLDLNLPAPNEEEEDDDDGYYSGFNSCWTSTEQKENAFKEEQEEGKLDSVPEVGGKKRIGFRHRIPCPTQSLQV